MGPFPRKKASGCWRPCQRLSARSRRHPGRAEPAAETDIPPVPVGPPLWWQQTWLIMLMLSISLFVGMAILTDNLLDGGVRLGWLACTVPLCLLGLLLSGLVWWANRSRWLHLRVLDRERQIRISLPLPLRPAAWLLRLARPWVPALKDTSIDELILSLEEVGGSEGPLTVLVDKEDGEHVGISIG